MGAKVVGLKFEVDGFPVVVKNTKEYSALLTKVEAKMNRISKIKASKAIPTDLKNLRQTSSVLTRIKNQLTAISKIKPIKTPATGGSPRKQSTVRPKPSSASGNNNVTREAIRNQGELKKALKETRQALDGSDFGTEKFRKLQVQQASLKNIQKGLRDDVRKTSQQLEFRDVNPTSIRGLELQYIKLRNQLKKLGDEERQTNFGKKLIADTARVKAKLNSVKLEFNDFTSNIGNYKSGLNSLGGSFRKLALTFGIGFGINEMGQAVTAGIKLFASFDQQLAILQSVSRSTKAELAPLKEEILRLGESTQFTAKQAADAATILARAGQSNEQILQTLEPTLRGAIATGSTIEDLADVTSKALASLGIPAKEAGTFVDQFTATLNTSNNDLSSYREALKEFAPTARSLKIPLEEVNATIGILGDNGLQGTVATTTLKTSLTRLSDESKKYAKAAKEAGVEVFNTNGEFVGMGQLVENLEKATAKLTDKEKQATISRIFGNQAVNQFSALLSAQKDVMVDGEKVSLSGAAALKGYTAQLANSSDAAKESAAIVGDTLSQDMLKFQSAVEGATISLVEGYNGGLRSFVQGLTELAPKLLRNIDLIFKIIAGVALMTLAYSKNAIVMRANALLMGVLNGQITANTIVAKINAITSSLATAARFAGALSYGVLTGKMGLATAAQILFNTAANKNPIGAIVIAITAAYLAYETYASFANEATRVQEAVNNAINEAKVQFLQEKRTLETLFGVLENDTASRKEKLKAIEALSRINPEYVKGIDAETTSTEILSAARAKALDLLRKETFEKVKNQKLSDLLAKEANELVRIEDLERRGKDAFTNVESALSGLSSIGVLNTPLEAANSRLNGIRSEISRIEEDFNNIINQPVKSKGRAAYIKQLNDEKKLLEAIKEQENSTNKASITGNKSVSDNQKDNTKEIIEAAKTGLSFYEAEISRLNGELESADTSQYKELAIELDNNEKKATGLREELERIKNEITASNREPLEILAEIEAGGLPDSIEAPTAANPLEGEGGIRADLNARKEATKEFLESTKLDQLNQERQILNEKLFNSDVEFKERLRIADELAAKELEIEREKETELDKIRDERYKKVAAVLSGVQEGLSVLSEIGYIRSQRQLNKVEQTYQREIELAGENEEAKEAAEEKFAAAKQKIDEKAFKRNQAFAITQALINGALAATQSLANTTLPFPISLTALIPIGIQTALQVASIRSQKFKGERGLYLSQDEAIAFGSHRSDSVGYVSSYYMENGGTVTLGGFAKGRRHGSGGIHTNFHGIPVEIEDGEFVDVMEDGGIAVINRKSSRAFAPTLKAGAGKVFNGKREMFSRINQKYGGVKFENGGVQNAFTPNLAALGRESLRGKRLDINVRLDSKSIGKEMAKEFNANIDNDVPERIEKVFEKKIGDIALEVTDRNVQADRSQ